MKIGITSDHAAHDLRVDLIPRLRDLGYDIVDRGPATAERTDYAAWGAVLAQQVAAGEFDLGIAICGSGIGISIACNKVRGIRAACVSESYSARMSRAHNNANILCFGARVVGPDVALDLCREFLTTQFEGGRHTGRVAQLGQLDEGDTSFIQDVC
ncbi:MAG: ribose 5-phosphate isomerase B [Arachnia propionica]|uniref:ribose 5-phosphate isomerase B n=1 Tax=Arachnia propionica TaxID=1750 RepID=UPI0026FF45C8|nr:ribose 5-phosphate isomerase B [Arachnia propionica]